MPIGILKGVCASVDIAIIEIHVANTNESLDSSDLFELLNILVRYIISQKRAKNIVIFIIIFNCLKFKSRKKYSVKGVVYVVKGIKLNREKAIKTTMVLNFSQKY